MTSEQVYRTIKQEKIIAVVRGVDEGRIINIAGALLSCEKNSSKKPTGRP